MIGTRKREAVMAGVDPETDHRNHRHR